MTHSAPSEPLFTNAEGQELSSHGTPLFPVGFYQNDLEHDHVPWHWHDEMELVMILSGETTVYAGRRRAVLREGQGFFINADTLHSAHGTRGTHCLFHSVVFHPRLVGGGIDSVFWQSYLRPLLGSGMKSMAFDGSDIWHPEVIRNIDRAWQAGTERAPGYEFKVRAALSEIVFLLTEHLPRNQIEPSEKALRDSERIRQMLRYVQRNYTENITAAEIAASASISLSECLRCFKSTIQIPPIQYLKRFRIQRACEIIGSTDRKIAEIAAECGFQDPAYFNRAFREIKGMTPGEYRQLTGEK